MNRCLQEDEICKEISKIMGDVFKDTTVSGNEILEWRREVMASIETMQSRINDKFGQRGAGNEKFVFA